MERDAHTAARVDACGSHTGSCLWNEGAKPWPGPCIDFISDYASIIDGEKDVCAQYGYSWSTQLCSERQPWRYGCLTHNEHACLDFWGDAPIDPTSFCADGEFVVSPP